MANKLEVFTMRRMEQAAAEADGAPLDAWLRHALRQAFGGVLIEPLPSDLLALAAGQGQSPSVQMVGQGKRLSVGQ
ncbi:hypothetical protein [Dankookia sp. GCM10030260]|uniref:hypothetical protein n=1 Tax=Dankookia sp. GCM10030260 TaxID=3273390 RepID=UPI0036D2DC24